MKTSGAPSAGIHPLQWVLLVVVLSLGVGTVYAQWKANGRLEQTAPLFAGFPTVMAAGLVVARPERTLKGLIFQGVTASIISVGIVLGDGYFWLLAFPFSFFYFSLVLKPEEAKAEAEEGAS